MNLRQLRLIQSLMQGHSLNVTARNIGISQPAATNLLRQVEHEFSLQLFVREKGRLVPTDEAVRLVPEISRVLEGVSLIQETVRELRDASEGSITLAATPTVSEALLPQSLSAFAARYPRTPIWVQVMAKRQVLTAVESGRVDLALVNAPFELPWLTATKLVDARVACYLPEGHPLAEKQEVRVEDVLRYPIISHLHSSIMNEFFAGIEEMDMIERAITISINHTATALKLVQEGAGIALTDPLGRCPLGVVRRRVVPEIEISPHLVMRKQITLTPQLRTLSGLLTEVAAAIDIGS
ncbi:LysR family transcriptional regulator [Devosia elaeis]|uniref:HTH lysR-type domain-containing protein n=1 Tax=Devosia elaeis TaxID=1770058 RepID=A0A178HLU2_9HYPH|nr:LysR family transcriptional regulator [Devosia elaeis]OAM72984.1 hypothetical protein A3840_18855 [Devosia elaeis]